MVDVCAEALGLVDDEACADPLEAFADECDTVFDAAPEDEWTDAVDILIEEPCAEVPELIPDGCTELLEEWTEALCVEEPGAGAE